MEDRTFWAFLTERTAFFLDISRSEHYNLICLLKNNKPGVDPLVRKSLLDFCSTGERITVFSITSPLSILDLDSLAANQFSEMKELIEQQGTYLFTLNKEKNK